MREEGKTVDGKRGEGKTGEGTREDEREESGREEGVEEGERRQKELRRGSEIDGWVAIALVAVVTAQQPLHLLCAATAEVPHWWPCLLLRGVRHLTCHIRAHSKTRPLSLSSNPLPPSMCLCCQTQCS